MITLNDISEFIIDCEHKTAPTQKTGYPSIRTPNIGKGKLLLEGVNRVSEEVYKEWTKRGIPKAGDLIIAREAPVGNVAIIPQEINVCLGQRTVLVRPNNNLVDSNYLCYLLLGDELQGQILSKASGSTVDHLNMKDIRCLKISNLPDLQTQKKIASILSAYDDLIENNNQRIQLLEDMAEEIYKEWFVRLRFPGYETSRFFDKNGVEVGREVEGALPEGWERKKFRECLAHYIGGGWGQESPKGKNTFPAHVIRGTDIPKFNIGQLNYDVLRFHSKSNLSSRICEPNDIIFEVSGGTEEQSLGRTAFLTKSAIDRFDAPVIAASFCKLLRFDSKIISPFLMNGLLNRMHSTGELKVYQVQSTGISNYQFEDFIDATKVIIPTKKIQLAFEKLVAPMFDEIQMLGAKNEVLQSTRDLLLPRLISGKLDVSEMEEVL